MQLIKTVILMNKLLIFFLCCLIIGCTTNNPSVYSEVYEELIASGKTPPHQDIVMWQRIKKSSKNTEKSLEEMASLDLKECVVGLEAKFNKEDIARVSNPRLFAQIQIYGCMHFKGWRPEILQSIENTNGG